MKRIRFIAKPILAVLICVIFANLFSVRTNAAPIPKQVIIAIDPAHGGDSTGAEYFGTMEKDITLTVSNYIKEYLEKFENVTVILTRTDDSNPTYTQRVRYASAHGAEVFISIHFNESENANRTGFEIWVPTDPKLQSKVMPVAECLSRNADHYIDHSEGIFTCKNGEGEDYYGQLRRAAQISLPAIIVQEMYMDRPENKAIIHSDEALKELAKQNALAIAQAYHLSSESLGVDYSEYKDIKYSKPMELTEEELVYPGDIELSLISFEQTSDTTCNAEFIVKTVDTTEIVNGYRYSLDRGKTYSGITKTTGGYSFRFKLTIKPSDEQILRVIAYNSHGLSVTSNEIELGRKIKLDPDFTTKKNEEAKQAALIKNHAEEDKSKEEAASLGVFDSEVRFSPTKSIVIVFGAAAGLAICLILLIGSVKPKKKADK